MQRTELGPGYSISRVIRGNWQLASGHGSVKSGDPASDLLAYAEAGITTFDCADIYTGVEETVGTFRLRYAERHGTEALEKDVQVHTKFVPDLDALPSITKAHVAEKIERSLTRLKAERLDLVQFHWWDFAVPRWLETAGWLAELRQAGKIRNVGVTNFDAPRLGAMVEAGVPLVSCQVQYSLLDRRPATTMAGAAAEHGVSLLAYGTVAGGFLGDRWLGAPEPGEFENRSLVKYKLIIDEWGGWELFQALLRGLRTVADRHETDIAAVASAFVLGWPNVSAVIVGARDRSHLPANLAVAAIRLTEEDRREIDAVLADATPVPGDVYEIERDRSGRHGAIMKYNLSKAPAKPAA